MRVGLIPAIAAPASRPRQRRERRRGRELACAPARGRGAGVRRCWSPAITLRCCGLAGSFVSSTAVAEEVVQDTWVGVAARDSTASPSAPRLRPGCCGSSSTARGARACVSVAAWPSATRAGRRPLPLRRVRGVDVAAAALGGGQRRPHAGARRLTGRIRSALGELPARQREVVVLRDVDGLSGHGGVRGARDQRGQPARACCTAGAATCARRWKTEMAERPMMLLGTTQRARLPADGRARHRLSRRAPCRARSGGASRPTLRAASTAPSTWSRCARRSAHRPSASRGSLARDARGVLGALSALALGRRVSSRAAGALVRRTNGVGAPSS